MAGSGKGSYPQEYVDMRFCEMFNVSPLEYYELPRDLVETWLQMKSIESSMGNVKVQHGRH